MINRAVCAERHIFVQAVDRAAGGVCEVFDRVCAARFENVEKADNVCVNVGLRVGQTVTHSRLRREVTDAIELFGGKEPVDRLFVGKIELDKTVVFVGFALHKFAVFDRARVNPALRQPPKFDANVVVIVDIVQPHDLIAAPEKPLRRVKTDKPRRPRYQNFHTPTPI